jgi:hypothetical protein
MMHGMLTPSSCCKSLLQLRDFEVTVVCYGVLEKGKFIGFVSNMSSYVCDTPKMCPFRPFRTPQDAFNNVDEGITPFFPTSITIEISPIGEYKFLCLLRLFD